VPGLSTAPGRSILPWWSGFALALVLPVSTLIFLTTGPHAGVSALIWTLPVLVMIVADRWGPSETRSIPDAAPRAFFDGLLWCLFLLQMANVLAMGWMVSRLEWIGSEAIVTSLLNLVVLRILCGTNACCSVIAPAHELIHRRSRWQRRIGRLMLMSVFYDHFFVSHRLGHHAQLGTAGDPSSCSVDESYGAFFWRSLGGQWKIAWRCQPQSLLSGLGVELVWMGLYLMAFGGLALFAWIYVSWVAIRLLEAVNYFQHFGLTSDSERSGETAWHCHSAVSLFMFLGLTRHADHHRRPGVAFTELNEVAGGLNLPFGYLVMAIWVKNSGGSFRRWAIKEMCQQAEAVRPCTETANAKALRS